LKLQPGAVQNVTHRTTSNGETQPLCYSGDTLGCTKSLRFHKATSPPPIIQTLFASLPGLGLHLFLFLTITFPPLFEGLPIVQPSRRAISLAEEVQNAVAVHPHALQDAAAATGFLSLRATTIVPTCDCHAGGANPESASMLRYVAIWLSRSGLVGGWGANAVEDQRDLDERWTGGTGCEKMG